jgi:hypothetical protein
MTPFFRLERRLSTLGQYATRVTWGVLLDGSWAYVAIMVSLTRCKVKRVTAPAAAQLAPAIP